MRIVTCRTLPVFCGRVSTPLRELSRMSRSERLLATLIQVAPTCATSPTWATPLAPANRVKLSTKVGGAV